MGRNGLFHLYLYVAVLRVDIVKLLLAAGAQVGFLLGVERLVQVQQRALTAQEEAQGVESGVFVVALRVGGSKLMYERRLDEQHRTEVEVIAKCP